MPAREEPVKPSPSPRPLRLRLAGLELDGRAALAIVLVTLLLMLDAYHSFFPAEPFGGALRAKALERLAYYLLLPLLIIRLVFRDPLRAYGWTVGDWHFGLRWSGILIAASVPVILAAGRTPAMAGYYAAYRGGFPNLLLTLFLDLVGWEFVFRGFLLFALFRVMGPTAVVVQAMPFALAHIGKPELETLSTIFGGTLFGWIALRSRSFLYPLLLHWFIFSLVVFVARPAL